MGNRDHDSSPATTHISEHVTPELAEMLFNSTSDGVFAVNDQMRIIAFNKAAEKILGISKEEALGRPCHEVLQANICHDNCALKYTLETNQPVVNLAVELRDARSRRIPVTISSAALRDAKGRVIGGVETFRNMNWVRKLVRDVEHHHPFADIVTDDPQMRHIFEILPTISASESCVLIHGETGTGKNLIAKALHILSPRRKGPLIIVNCGALPETLLESEIFGYRAGAFTGAVRDRKGRIAAAEGGTLFLDEIGDMPLSMQVKLLRFLQDHVYERLGDDRTFHADVRIVTATNRNLMRLVDEGAFRRDLYYRINVLSIELPPLRDRRRDIPLLVQAFLDRHSQQRGKQLAGISSKAILMDHDYPGNVRELENIVEHAFVLCPGPEIEVQHLPQHLVAKATSVQTAPAQEFSQLEARFLRDALERNRWNRQATANELGIHKTTLLRRVRRLGLQLPKVDGRSTRAKRQ
jgi:PAS domain S-box-containing protein